MSKYWFRQKSFGYGATPNSWQGWLLTIIGLLLILGVVYEAQGIADRGTQMLVTLSGVAAVLIPFVAISYIKTEGGWRWRSGKDDSA